MPDICANIKAELETNHEGLTALAQLVAVYTSAGIISAADISKRTGYSERAIRKAKAELGCRNPGATGTPVPEPECRGGTPVPQAEPECRNPDAASCARIVTPSGFLSTSVVEGKVPPIPPAAKPTAKRGTRLDRDWQLPDDWRVWARTNFPASTDASVAEQAAIFRDFWIAKPGAQACKLDWEATWRNWCRKGLSAAGMVRKPQYTGSFNSPQRQPGKQSMRDVIEAMKAAETAGVAA